MAGEVFGELSMPVAEHLLQQACRNRRVDTIGDSRARGIDHIETVFVSPLPHQCHWKRTPPVTHEGVEKTCRRIVAVGMMLRGPPQAGGKAKHGAPVG